MNTAQPTVWTGTVSDEQQAKVPWVVGVALVLGVFLWMGPYMGVNVVLLPAKTALLAGDGKASVVAVLSTSAMIVAAIANIIFGALSDLTRSRFGRRSPWIIGGSVLAAAAMMFVSWAPTVPLLIVGWCVYQCFLNAIVAPLIAVITDRTAPKFRGTISAMYALGYSVGIYGGQMIGARFLTDLSCIVRQVPDRRGQVRHLRFPAVHPHGLHDAKRRWGQTLRFGDFHVHDGDRHRHDGDRRADFRQDRQP